MIEEFRTAIAKKLVDSTLGKASRWANHRIYLPKPYEGFMRFDKFPWLKDIMDIDNDTVTIRKGSQMGLSVAAIAKSLHLVVEKQEDLLYVLPTATLVGDFSKGRLEPILFQSPELSDIWSEANVGYRRTNDATSMYIRGSKSEAGLVSIPLGNAIIDEYDRCSTNTLALVFKRFSARENFYLMALSTPTLPEFGIDGLYKQGTQEQFRFPCPGCGKKIGLLWPESVEICGDHYQSDDCERSFYKCHECGCKLPHETKTEWLKKAYWEKTQNVTGHRSFHINQLYSPGMSAPKIVREYLKGEISEVSRIEFFNQGLGLSYIMEGARVTPDLIERCIRSHRKEDPRPTDGSRMICMGVDVGAFLDTAIVEFIYSRDPGTEPYLNSTAKVLWEGRFAGSDWAALDMLMREWQVQHAVVDFQPETVLAGQFARRFHGFVSLCQYRQGTSGEQIKIHEDENGTATLTVDRTIFMDLALGRIHKGRVEYPQDLSATTKEHLQAPVRTYEIDSDGRPKAVYQAIRDDHMAHAFTYAEIAHFRAYAAASGRAIKAGESFYNF